MTDFDFNSATTSAVALTCLDTALDGLDPGRDPARHLVIPSV
jgi:hypothetical protein